VQTGYRQVDMGARRFGRWNLLGLRTLIAREIMRFLKVWTQTLLAPLITAGLFLAVFALAIGPGRGQVMGVAYVTFLAPGILVMNVIQNAFANASSSIMGSKVQGNIVDTLMPPLSPLELTVGYIAGAVARGLMVALPVWLLMALTVGTSLPHPVWALAFAVSGSAFMGGLGIMAGIFSQRFDQMAAITNFVITPLSFLSGTFYSIQMLPAPLEAMSRVNPMFYVIDGVRFGMLGRSDASPWLGLGVVLAATSVAIWGCWMMFRTGYRLKS